ncbi:flagellar hook-associated protein FlgK [Zavarzinia aquatilis]|uniref:Flagellar hook-associated protein 1 n=1 Tax=Zavarzinia aquatilis TaxID=2211142 RepID=A0A317DW52_9PROT|nr:flagellar hook-associated protein FlgK [Zavarzinia aquatilis]PWR18584.1 flagellar hook-associated protein FlgK [Zavarzinia aquatilis]
MSLTGAMNIALTGLNAQQRALQVLSGNVSNATDETYTRKSLNTETGAGGVTTADVTRATDNALARDLLAYTSLAGQAGAQSTYMSKLSTLFGVSTSDAGLATAVEDLNAAFAVLQATPDSSTAQAEVIAKADALAGKINDLSAGLETIDREIQQDTATKVQEANGYLERIDTLNKQIKTVAASGGDKTTLEDQRDAAVRALAGLVDVKTIARGDGSLAVYTAGGESLVDQDATTLAYDGTDITRAGDTRSLNGSIRSGEIAGLLALRATGTSSTAGTAVIDELQAQVQAFAASLTSTGTGDFATAYDGATTATGELASGFFVMTGSSIAVNPALLDGTASLKQAAIAPAAAALVSGSHTLSAGGLTVTGEDYAGLARSIISSLSADVGAVTNKADLASATKSEAATRFQSSVGVNMDEELANLQVLQNAYAASAKVMQTVNQLYESLFAIIR